MSKKELLNDMKETRKEAMMQVADVTATPPVAEIPEITSAMKEHAVTMEVIAYCQKHPDISVDALDKYTTKCEMKLEAHPELAAKYAFVEKYEDMSPDEKDGIDYFCYEAMSNYLDAHPNATPYDLLAVRGNAFKEVMELPNLKEILPEFIADYKNMEENVDRLNEDDVLTEAAERSVAKYASAHHMETDNVPEDISACLTFKSYKEAIKEDKVKNIVQNNSNTMAMLSQKLR